MKGNTDGLIIGSAPQTSGIAGFVSKFSKNKAGPAQEGLLLKSSNELVIVNTNDSDQFEELVIPNLLIQAKPVILVEETGACFASTWQKRADAGKQAFVLDPDNYLATGYYNQGRGQYPKRASINFFDLIRIPRDGSGNLIFRPATVDVEGSQVDLVMADVGNWFRDDVKYLSGLFLTRSTGPHLDGQTDLLQEDATTLLRGLIAVFVASKWSRPGRGIRAEERCLGAIYDLIVAGNNDLNETFRFFLRPENSVVGSGLPHVAAKKWEQLCHEGTSIHSVLCTLQMGLEWIADKEMRSVTNATGVVEMEVLVDQHGQSTLSPRKRSVSVRQQAKSGNGAWLWDALGDPILEDHYTTIEEDAFKSVAPADLLGATSDIVMIIGDRPGNKIWSAAIMGMLLHQQVASGLHSRAVFVEATRPMLSALTLYFILMHGREIGMMLFVSGGVKILQSMVGDDNARFAFDTAGTFISFDKSGQACVQLRGHDPVMIDRIKYRVRPECHFDSNHSYLSYPMYLRPNPFDFNEIYQARNAQNG